ncbi:Hypothetical protein BAN_0075500 [Borrelia anserina BA2]|uniref:Uncharacterized protein n=1 Tax=Borrelia anserina BA2 TaxID=1313293 RepID=W5SND4_BORAN|nr:Hypothetical protein BAN_0075500 [Borrelia anserina BA2]
MYNKTHFKANKNYQNFNMDKKLIYILLIILFLSYLSCFNKNNKYKYGIVLDSNNREKLPNGSLVNIEDTNQEKKQLQ